MAINEHRRVTGVAGTVGGSFHAYLYADGVTYDLGTLGGSWSRGEDLNDNGVIVGRSVLAGDVGAHAFVQRDGVMYDLNTLHDFNLDGWELENAQAINNAGAVVCYGRHNGVIEDFVAILSE